MISVIKRQSPYARKGEESILKITDKKNKSFIMEIGGNSDMYWIPENDLPNDEASGKISFEFERDDEFFDYLSDVFSKIKKKDNPYVPTLTGNAFTHASEDTFEEEANVLQIIQQNDRFIVDFYKQKALSMFSMMKRGFSICFCNSGSRHQDIEQIFKLKFLEVAYGYKFPEPGE